jgi:hypothetical protein
MEVEMSSGDAEAHPEDSLAQRRAEESHLTRWWAAFKNGFMGEGVDKGRPPCQPVFVTDVKHNFQWGDKGTEHKRLMLVLMLSGPCCGSPTRQGRVHVNVLMSELDASEDGGLAVTMGAVKEAVLDHLRSAPPGRDGKAGGGCNLMLDAHRDVPVWGLRLILEQYARLRDDFAEVQSRKLDREGNRKVDHSREWLEEPMPLNSAKYYYQKTSQGRRAKCRELENLQKVLFKMCKGSMPKVKVLFRTFAERHGWDAEALMSFEVRDKVHRALEVVDRAKSVVQRLRVAGTHTADASKTLSILVSCLCPQRVDPDRRGGLQPFFTDIGVKRCLDVKWALRALERRWSWDVHDATVAALPAVIEEGELVTCRGGDGTLLDRDHATGAITIHMNDTQLPVSYDSEGRAGARLRRAQPSLFPAPKNKPDGRSIRAEIRRTIMEEFLLRENVQSPNKKDKVTRFIGYKAKEEKLIVWRMVPWDELWATFKEDPAHKEIVDHYRKGGGECKKAPPSFISAAPWWMRKGKDEACLCLTCEELACKHRAQCVSVRRLTQILKELEDEGGAGPDMMMPLVRRVRDVLSQRTKSGMCKESLKPCLHDDSDLSTVKGCCERGECKSCGFANVWSKLRAKLVGVASNADGEHIEDYRSDGVNSLWKEKMLWQGCVKRPRPIAGGTLTASDDDEYVSSVKSARDAVLQTTEGSLVEFLDALDVCFQKHVPHRILQSQTHSAQQDLNRNRRPGDGVFKNMDFSENAGPKNARLLQADHWTGLNFTLFISIYNWVVSKEWDKTSGVLPQGSEVTVGGEFSGGSINQESFWGTVEDGNGDLECSMVRGDGGVSHILTSSSCSDFHRSCHAQLTFLNAGLVNVLGLLIARAKGAPSSRFRLPSFLPCFFFICYLFAESKVFVIEWLPAFCLVFPLSSFCSHL